MKHPSLAQQNFAITYLQTGNLYQSAIKAGYSHTVAKNARKQVLELPSTQRYIEQIGAKLDPFENTWDYIIGKLKEQADQIANPMVSLKALDQLRKILLKATFSRNV